MQSLARLGYAARGVVYLIVGWFAVLAAVGSGETKNTDDALLTVLSGPFGRILLGLVALGLACYAAWRLVQAISDPDGHGTSWKGLAIRAALLIAAVTYAGLAVSAASLVMGNGGSEGGGSNGMVQEAVGFLGSRAVAALLALAFLAAASAHAVKAWKRGYEKYLSCDRETLDRIRPVAQTGLIARGIVFLVFAGLMGWRAWTASGSAEPPQLRDALETVRDMPFGWGLLLLIGLGLVAFAAYSGIEALYRRIDIRTPNLPHRISKAGSRI
ncbi:DUF1206 domain-containing protein [Chthonobacter albigriseus]|uniref:DUF1206 domain-containing protein n=1 Tax=Chthonobacter albigriseus TaxID=1683161 RepID=UPI0015EF0B1E|nr:DUF1206 domain-containing protein [Chthonobacter albigriseus]